MNPTLKTFLITTAGSIARKAVTAAATLLTAHGLGALTDSTQSNLTEVAAGALLLLGNFALSYVRDHRKELKIGGLLGILDGVQSGQIEPHKVAVAIAQSPAVNPKPTLPVIAPLVMLGFLVGCATTSQTAVSDIKTAISNVDNSANAFLQNPLTQLGARPAGQLLTFGLLFGFSLNGDVVAPYADQVCYWEKLVYSAMGTGMITPDQVDAIGVTFGNNNLNATDPKFSMAFGQIQTKFKSIIGTPGVSRETIMDFLLGLGDGAASFCTPKTKP